MTNSTISSVAAPGPKTPATPSRRMRCGRGSDANARDGPAARRCASSGTTMTSEAVGSQPTALRTGAMARARAGRRVASRGSSQMARQRPRCRGALSDSDAPISPAISSAPAGPGTPGGAAPHAGGGPAAAVPRRPPAPTRGGGVIAGFLSRTGVNLDEAAVQAQLTGSVPAPAAVADHLTGWAVLYSAAGILAEPIQVPAQPWVIEAQILAQVGELLPAPVNCNSAVAIISVRGDTEADVTGRLAEVIRCGVPRVPAVPG